MTKRDYELIAHTIIECRLSSPDPRIDDVAQKMAHNIYRAAIEHGWSFDTSRFLRACGVKGEPLQ